MYICMFVCTVSEFGHPVEVELAGMETLAGGKHTPTPDYSSSIAHPHPLQYFSQFLIIVAGVALDPSVRICTYVYGKRVILNWVYVKMQIP